MNIVSEIDIETIHFGFSLIDDAHFYFLFAKIQKRRMAKGKREKGNKK